MKVKHNKAPQQLTLGLLFKRQLLAITIAALFVFAPSIFSIYRKYDLFVELEKYNSIDSSSIVVNGHRSNQFLTFNLLTAQEEISKGKIGSDLINLINNASSTLQYSSLKLEIYLTQSSMIAWSYSNESENLLFIDKKAAKVKPEIFYVELLHALLKIKHYVSSNHNHQDFLAQLTALDISTGYHGRSIMNSSYLVQLQPLLSEEILARFDSVTSLDDLVEVFANSGGGEKIAAQVFYVLNPAKTTKALLEQTKVSVTKKTET